MTSLLEEINVYQVEMQQRNLRYGMQNHSWCFLMNLISHSLDSYFPLVFKCFLVFISKSCLSWVCTVVCLVQRGVVITFPF
jgi:hypothetical protein